MFTRKITFRMQFIVKNLGVIESAEIELKGITALAGYNDTGKSFIGKMIYSIIKTIRSAAKFDEDQRMAYLYSTLDRIDRANRRIYLTRNTPDILSQIRNTVTQNSNTDRQYLIESINQYQEQIFSQLKNFREDNSRITKEDLEGLIKEIESYFETSKFIILEKRDEETIFKNYFQSVVINGIFDNNINCIYKDSICEVKLIEGSTVLLSLSVQANKITSFKYNSVNFPLFKDDAILIETPAVLSLDKYFYPNLRYEHRTRELPIQYFDLLTKMRTHNDSSPVLQISEVSKEINEIIGGRVNYEETNRNFVFQKENSKQKIPSTNIATGIKSFAIIQMLNENGHLTPDTILILDEPEVHLHPEWEIKYARLLFTLCKAGVFILMTTHSGYFVQAISKYLSDFDMENKVTFYFGEKSGPNKLTTTFTNVTNDLNPIFKALSKPMQDIYNQ